MRKITYFTLILMMTLLSSCNDFLNLPPLNKITEDQIFGTEAGIESYMATLYNKLPIEDFNYGSESGFNNWISGCFVPAISCDEAIHCEWPHEIMGPTDNRMWNQWWAYDNIRNVNELIQNLSSSTLFAEARRTELLAEAHAIRAWYYFGMVKRYGGVPIIKSPQVYDPNNLEALLVSRNTEEESYNFILEDLNYAIENLPNTRAANEKYRINRFSAAALKTRAMLFAASIAKYGTYDKNGVVGFDNPNKAKKYYEEVISAAKIIIEEGNYSLFRENSDKAKNYQELFWVKGDCPEVIFVKKYQYPSKTHNWDLWQAPWGYRLPEGYGSRLSPTLNLAEAFKMADGTSGVLNTNSDGWVVDASGKIMEFDDRTDLFKGRDSRLYATIMIPGSKWTNAKGDVSGIIDVQKGIVELNNQNVTILKEGGAFTDEYQYGNTTLNVIGKQGIGGTNESTITGLYIKKSLFEGNAPNDPKHSSLDQDWLEFRYAEVLLNYAEAAAELASLGESQYASNGLAYLNDVRDRAGVEAAPALTIETVREEMQVEFMYENHRLWDLKRWREADKLMNNVKMKGLYPYYVANTQKWIFKKLEVGNAHDFKPYMYYIRINDDQINLNPNIVQNPGY